MRPLIGVTTDSGRFGFRRIPKQGARPAYAVVDAESVDHAPIGHVWARQRKTWMAVGRDRVKRGPYPTRLAAAKALVESGDDGE